MNQIRALATEYIKPSTTIEVILVSTQTKGRVFYVYNYEGYHYRLFENILDLIAFFEGENPPYLEFNTDVEINRYLEAV